MQPTVTAPRTDEHRRRLAEICALAFNASVENAMQYGERSGWETYRLALVDGQAAACLGVHDFGQWFGGRVVPCAGVAAVASALTHRGGGVVKFLLRECLREQHERGIPISTLYPATRGLYRKVGYEDAGSHFDIEIAPRDIDVRSHAGEVRRLLPTDRALMESLYERRASATAGNLRRNDFLWQGVFHTPTGEERDGVVVSIDGRPEGYLSWSRTPTVNGWHSLTIRDFVATTPESGARLLTLLADHRTQVDKVSWRGAAADPLLMLLHEQPYKVRLKDHWLLRVLDAPRAIAARGYPPETRGQVAVEIHGDDVIETNNGRFVIRIGNGVGIAAQGGDGAVRIHIRGLAPLYTGHFSAEDLALAGLLTGPSPSLRVLSAMFAGPCPWMPDMF